MRDIIIVLAVITASAYAIRRPWIGIVAWAVISLANPHRNAWGFAYSFPVAALIGATTLLGLFITRDRVKLPWHFPVVAMALFAVWTTITLPFSIRPFEVNYEMWNRVLKIMLMNFVALAVLHDRKQIQVFVWAVVLSIAFYGVKGGFFTVATGGSFRVWGPPDSFIEGNNELALALIMIIPLAFYLREISSKAWVRHALVVGALLCVAAALGSHSRGALVAIAAMTFVLWLKMERKLVTGVAIVVVASLLIAFMPDNWSGRMGTIQSYDQDESAMGRINAWWMAWNLAVDRPLGGGFQIYSGDIFARYAPIPEDVHAAHSIYFQILGEHGFVGLFLFLAIFFGAWTTSRWNIRHSAHLPDCKWVGQLSRMTQVGLIGYAVGGAFLSLAYFDLPYYMMIMLVIARRWLEERLESERKATQPLPQFAMPRRGRV